MYCIQCMFSSKRVQSNGSYEMILECWHASIEEYCAITMPDCRPNQLLMDRVAAVSVQVDMVGKSNHILAVPMLRQALRWQEQVQGDPLAQPLLLLLADCCHRLRTNYANFILDRVTFCCPLSHMPSADWCLYALAIHVCGSSRSACMSTEPTGSRRTVDGHSTSEVAA